MKPSLTSLPSPPPASGPADEPRDLDGLYRRHVQRVARWVTFLGGPSIDVEDTVQEVFLTVKALLPGFRGEARITTWLYEITTRITRRERRRARWRRWLSGSAEDVGAELVSHRPTPVEELERRQRVARLYRLLDSLGETQRTVFILYELEGLSGQEIAELTGLKLKTLWVRLHRARQQFEDRRAKLERIEGARIEAAQAQHRTGGRR